MLNVWRLFAFLVLSFLFFQSQTTIAYAQSKAQNTARVSVAPATMLDRNVLEAFTEQELDDTYSGLTSKFSKDAVLYNNIGATYFKRKSYDKAESALKRAIVLNNHPAFLTNLSIVYETLDRYTEAINAAQRAVTQSPRYERGRMQLCELFVTAKRNNDALICYDELSKFATLDPLSKTLYGLTNLRIGKADRAISLVDPLVRGQQPTPLMYNVLGFAYYQKKRFTQAAETFKRGVELDPDSPNLRYNLAMALTASDNRVGAISQYNFVKKANPEMAEKLYRNLYRDKIIFVNDNGVSKLP